MSAHFKRHIIIVMAFFCSLLRAETHITSFTSPAEQLTTAEISFENRLDFCRKFKRLTAEYFDLWLQAQSFELRRILLSDLGMLANDRCYGEQRNAYSNALIRHAAITGDKTKVNEWIAFFFDKPYFDQSYQGKKSLKLPKSEYLKQLDRLSQLPAYYMPFDMVKAVEAIAPLDDWLIEDIAEPAYGHNPDITGLAVPHIQ